MPSAVNISQVPANSTAMVAGVISYSRVVKKIDGDDLVRENQRRAQRGWSAVENPFTTITLNSAEIIPADPNNLSIMEQYIQGRFYISNDTSRNPGNSFTVQNKGRYLPAVGVRQADGSFAQVYPDEELAAGQHVILILRVYPTRAMNGLTFDAVLVDAPEIQYANPGNGQLATAMANHGLVWHPSAQPKTASTPEQIAQQAANTLPLTNAAPSVIPTAEPTMVPIQQAQPMTNRMPQTVPAAVPVQQAMPQTVPAAVQQQPNHMPQTVPSAVPVATPVMGGIIYDPTAD